MPPFLNLLNLFLLNLPVLLDPVFFCFPPSIVFILFSLLFYSTTLFLFSHRPLSLFTLSAFNLSLFLLLSFSIPYLPSVLSASHVKVTYAYVMNTHEYLMCLIVLKVYFNSSRESAVPLRCSQDREKKKWNNQSKLNHTQSLLRHDCLCTYLMSVCSLLPSLNRLMSKRICALLNKLRCDCVQAQFVLRQ